MLERLVGDGVVSPQERAAFVGSDGELNPDGRKRIEQLVLGRFFADPTQLDSIAPSIRNQVARIAAPLAQVETSGAWSLTPDMREAVTLLERAQKQGSKNLDDYLKQESLFGAANYSPEAVTLARSLKGMKAEQLKAAARQYAGDASMAAKGSSLFGADPTPALAFADAFGAYTAPANALSGSSGSMAANQLAAIGGRDTGTAVASAEEVGPHGPIFRETRATQPKRSSGYRENALGRCPLCGFIRRWGLLT